MKSTSKTAAGENSVSRRALMTFILSLFSVLICLLLAESVLRAFVPKTQFLDLSTDLYWKTLLLEKSSELSANDIHTKATVYDRELGWRMQPLYAGERANHNSHGFRGKRENTLKTQNSRIFVVGDSFTYGLGVSDDETFPAYLSQISGMEVVNAGVNAYGVDQAFLTWEKTGRSFDPTTVILGYFVDDFFRNALTIRDRPKPYFFYDIKEHEFRLKNVPVPDIDTVRSEISSELKKQIRLLEVLDWIRKRIQRKFGFLDYEDLQRKAQLSNYIMSRLNESVQNADARLLIVIIGHCYDGQSELMWVEKSIVEACHSSNVECINLAQAMREEDYESYYGDNCHWSERGHYFAANKIADALDLTHASARSLPETSNVEKKSP